MALVVEVGNLGKLKIEGVPSTAVCLLLMASNLFFFPLSKAADADMTFCSLVVVPGPSQGAW
jgi:hypothetical protein